MFKHTHDIHVIEAEAQDNCSLIYTYCAMVLPCLIINY